MKKLLLILLLIPSFASAEEVNLICDGETRVTNESGHLFGKYANTHIITIKDSTLFMKDINYSGEHFEINRNEYIAWYTPLHPESTYPSSKININRVTGKMKYKRTKPHVIKETNTRKYTYNIFEGICRKGERKF